jgi:SHS2 domain-containing protein
MGMDIQSGTVDQPETAVSEVDHTADDALLIRGADFGKLLQNAAMGLYRLVGTTGTGMPGKPPVEKQVSVDAQDAEGLLVEWLSELAFWVETEFFIGSDIRFLEIGDRHLKAAISGYRADRVEKLIKAVTYHDLKILVTPNGLEATVVFDV